MEHSQPDSDTHPIDEAIRPYLRHPALQAKKHDEAQGIWQARVNEAWRFHLTVEGDVYCLHKIKAHPKSVFTFRCFPRMAQDLESELTWAQPIHLVENGLHL
jgi:hypothetical protein